MADKARLRKRLRAARLAVPVSEISQKSAVINERLRQATDWDSCRSVHCFETIRKQNEVDTADFVDFLLKKRKVAVYTTRLLGGRWQTVAQRVADTSEEEPLYDAIVVPMLGFDERLYRLGYGSGFYDKLLAAQPQALKIGLCFELGRVGELPVQSHDVQLDMIITETHIYTRER